MNIKKTVLILTLLMLGSLFATANSPCDPQNRQRQEKRAMQSPAQIATKLAKSLKLTDEQSEKFIPLYADYMEDMKKLIEKHKVHHNENVSDKELEKIIESRFVISRSIIELREKYYKKYKKFLSIRQIDKLYETEKKLDNRRPDGNRPKSPRRNKTQRR